MAPIVESETLTKELILVQKVQLLKDLGHMKQNAAVAKYGVSTGIVFCWGNFAPPAPGCPWGPLG